MKLNHAILGGFTLCLAAWVLGCEPAPDYDDSRNGLKCSGNECKIDNHTLICSDDGLHIYESIDTSINVGAFSTDIPLGNWNSDEFNFGLYDYMPSTTTEGTIVKYDYICRHESGYSCKIINNRIGCYRQCEIRNGNDMNWCEQYENTNHHLFIQNQCILNPADGKYYSNSKSERTFCSSDRTCDNKNGCMTLVEEDGKPCDKSQCIIRDGQSYALSCESIVESSNDRFFIATPCEACAEGKCLEKCSTKDDIKYTCHDSGLGIYPYGESTQWKCSLQSNGKTYWKTKKTEECQHKCADDGQCAWYPGEGNECSPADYQSECVGDGDLLYCNTDPHLGAMFKVRVAVCKGIGSDLGVDMTCLKIKNGTANDAQCGSVENLDPCTNVGEKKTICTSIDPNDPESSAFRYQVVCSKLSDGSLRYVMDINTIARCVDRCNDQRNDCPVVWEP